MKPVSELLTQSWQLYKKHFSLLAGYAAWLLLPYAGLILVSLPQPNVFFKALSTLCFLAQGILAIWLGILIPLLVQELIKNKEKIPIIDLQNRAWQIISSVIFVAILEIAVFLGGLILLIIPAFIFWVWFSLAQLSVVLDNKKGLAAMAWSRELARGRFWKLTGRLIAGPLIFGIIGISISGLLIVLFSVLSGTSFDSLFNQTQPLWTEIISTVIETFSLPLFLIYFTLLYFEVRDSSCNSRNDKIIKI